MTTLKDKEIEDIFVIVKDVGRVFPDKIAVTHEEYRKIKASYISKEDVRQAVGTSELVPPDFETKLPDKEEQMNYKGRMWARNDLRKEIKKELGL